MLQMYTHTNKETRDWSYMVVLLDRTVTKEIKTLIRNFEMKPENYSGLIWM